MQNRSSSRVLRFAVTGALLGGGAACTSKHGAAKDERPETADEGPFEEPRVNEGPEPDPDEGPKVEPIGGPSERPPVPVDEQGRPLPTANPGPEDQPTKDEPPLMVNPVPPEEVNPPSKPPLPRTNVGRVRSVPEK
jgi:hypothetical protein